jgi:putative membrane protein
MRRTEARRGFPIESDGGDEQTKAGKPTNDRRVTEFLASERTFLAWIRTSISVVSLGFVVAKFGVWLRELAGRALPGPPLRGSGTSLPIGVSMMAFGALLAVLAVWRYSAVNRAIERGEAGADRALVVLVTVLVVLLATAMIIVMVLPAGSA